MSKISNLILAAITAAFFVSTAQAQQEQKCYPYADVAANLNDRYQEYVIGRDVVNKHLIELYKSESGSWSYVLTRPDGFSCIMSAGKNWEIIEPNKKEKPNA